MLRGQLTSFAGTSSRDELVAIFNRYDT